MTDDRWIRSRLGKGDRLSGGKRAWWKQVKGMKNVTQEWYTVPPYILGVLSQNPWEQQSAPVGEANNVAIGKLSAYRRPS